jgi:hypothetical protein
VFTKLLGPAGRDEMSGETLAWLHEPDMALGGHPVEDVGGIGSLRINSLIGGQVDRLQALILGLPDTVTSFSWRLTVTGRS